MDVRKLMLLAGALLFAGVAAVFARSMFAANSPAQAAAAPVVSSGTEVLVAVKPLSAGTIVTPEQVAFRPWPRDMVDGAYYVKGVADSSALAGKVVRVPITPGQPVTQGALVGPGERGFLAAALGPGMRAVTIAVSDASGVGGFAFPGDHVDIVLTQEVTGEGRPLKVSETIARDLRVLAVDQTADNPTKEAKVGRTLTLEATPKIAEKIAVGQVIGTLSLTLRAIAETPEELAALQAGDGKPGKHVPTDVDTTFTTGGEVSRFQRNNAPPQPSTGGGAPAPAAAPSGPAAPPRPKGPVVNVFRGSAASTVNLAPAVAATGNAVAGSMTAGAN